MGPLASHASRLLAEACSSRCIEDECNRLSTLLSLLNDSVDPRVLREDYMQATVIALISSMARRVAEEAWARGCRREAMMLKEAAALLASISR